MGMLHRLLVYAALASGLAAPQAAQSQYARGALAAESAATIAIRVSVSPSFHLKEKESGELQIASNAPTLRYHLQLEHPRRNAAYQRVDAQPDGDVRSQREDKRADTRPSDPLLVLVVPD